jgi:PTH1 family peptidyl-tRNA hydrolase
MQIWVGLGNPGDKYAGHRHNIGFMVIDEIASHFNYGKAKAKFKGQIQDTAMIGGVKIALLKPMTFMNDSGQSVRAAMDFYKVPLENITVFHDELDLDFGKIRQKIGGGIAGHNGLRSIKQHCGNEFRRIRIGIDHPGHKDRVHSHVLSDFRKDETDLRDDMIDAMARNAELLAQGQPDLYQTRIMESLK